MYTIGISDYEFIKITHTENMYYNGNFWTEIKNIEYNTNLKNSTIFSDYDDAVSTLEDITKNFENVIFKNSDIIFEIVDRNKGFDKKDYVSKLKIYSLIPTLVN